jgi:hyperosmotically inducible protein
LQREQRTPLVRESKQFVKPLVAFVNLKDMGHVIRKRFASFLVLGLFAAAPSAHAQRPPVARTTAGAPKPEEPQLSREIRHQLIVLPYYSVFDYIGFTLDGDRVTLTGYVLRPTLRSNAEAAVKSLEGVSSVKNLIEILPKSPSDDDSRRSVYRAIFEDSALQRYGASEIPVIHIILQNGQVRLEGAVATEAEKSLATSRASGVPGVSGVTNNIAIRPQGAHAN